MRESGNRPFDWGDFLALELAVGVGLLWAREAWLFRQWGEEMEWVKIFDRSDVLDTSARVMVLVAVALVISRLRRPRAELRQVRRQYGFLACLGALAGWLYSELNNRDLLRAESWEAGLADFWSTYLSVQEIGCVAFGVWLLAVVSGGGRCERCWVDRAGRLVGLYWVAAGLMFNYV